jgi:hypothetical protein
MKAILAAFALAIKEIKAKADSALSGMGPIDQYEGAREVSYAINCLQWTAKEVETMLNKVSEIEAKFEPEVQAAAAALMEAKINEQVAAGELVRKSDVEAAVAAVRKEATEAAETAFAAREEEARTVAARRKEIETAHGAEAAAALSDDSLKGDDAAFAAFKTEFDRRVKSLGEIGVTAAANKDAFAKIACGHGFDEAGVTAFDSNVELVKGLVPSRAAGSAAASAKPPGSGQPPAPATAPVKTDAPAYAF